MAVIELEDLSGNTELTAGTYLLSGNRNCNNFTLTYNCAAGDIVIKRSGDYYFTNVGVVNTTNSDSTHKVYWTVKNDDTIGEVVEGSTGVPAVLGGSYNNGTVIGNYNLRFKYWEVRWVDNKPFLNMAPTNSYYRDVQYITFKNCSWSSVTVLDFTNNAASYGTSNASNVTKYFNCDNTNSLTGTSIFLHYSSQQALNYVYVANSNSSNPMIKTGYLVAAVATPANTLNYLNITNLGSGYAYYNSDNRTTLAAPLTFKHSKFNGGIYSQHPSGTVAAMQFRNCVIINKGAQRASNTTYIYYNYFNCIFKDCSYAINGFSTSVIVALRNCIFDTCSLVSSGTPNYIYGVKNNGYYDVSSYTGWTAGSYDTWINNPNWTNFPSGTLHPDWLTYGPGDGWYTTEDIPTGADTNSFVGIDVATQSHTGATETATTQRLGLAPVFSALA